MALEEQTPNKVVDKEQQHSHPVVIANTDLINEDVEESIQLNHKLNQS